MARDFQVVVDCTAPHPLAEWWADVLQWDVEPSDEAFIRKMVDEGYAPESETMTYKGVLVWASGAAIRPDASVREGQRVLFQQVPEGKTVKNRLHLDVRVGPDQIEAERDRLVAAGATFLHEGHQGPHRWFTLQDPEGNEFCIT